MKHTINSLEQQIIDHLSLMDYNLSEYKEDPRVHARCLTTTITPILTELAFMGCKIHDPEALPNLNEYTTKVLSLSGYGCLKLARLNTNHIPVNQDIK